MSDEIEQLIERDDWVAARRAILRGLRSEPESHWLKSRLALTHYEQRQYSKALEVELDAYDIAPYCPMVLWGLAGTLQMLGRHEEALPLYRRIIRRGIERLTHGPCGESSRRARGIMADSWYRMAHSYRALGKRRYAADAYRKHLERRGPGCESIYAIADVRKELNALAP